MSHLRLRRLALAALVFTSLGAPGSLGAASPAEPGLLFHLSADHGTTADFSAAGRPAPTFDSEVTTIPDGARGPALRCGSLQRLAWRAPGHLYAQRGTVAFFWRSREPVGPTEFPLFRVAFSDHSSWDMVFLRIDYNGRGFDAFVTDTGLARIRVSTTVQPFPAPGEWTHLAFAWDENTGVRLHVNGRLAAARDQSALLDAGLDQFGPHSRVISPQQVQSDYNFVRGGDIDELRTYDRMLDAAAIAALSRREPPASSPAVAQAALPATLDPAGTEAGATPHRSSFSAVAQASLPATLDSAAAWAWRHGWNRPADLPPPLPALATTVRKVEIHDAHDLKRWWWKANDGIRETTWPGVYNRSQLPGRNDYFQLPDWDCYVESGRAITFILPTEPVNHLEITGPAFGALEAVGSHGEAAAAQHLFERPRGQGKTVHRLADPLVGGSVRITNTEPETPIEEFAAYHVTAGREPTGRPTLAYRVGFGPATHPSLASLATFIRNRHPAGEQAIAVAVPATDPVPPGAVPMLGGLPVLNILIPATASDPAYDLATIDGALDGIALDLPIVGVNYPVSLNIRVKDPLWPARDLLDFTFTLRPGETPTLWLDLRDRLLPPGRGLYLALAASAPLDPSSLAPAVRLVFKPAAEGRAEHAADRFTQVRDAYGMFVEERPGVVEYDLFNRLDADLRDLMRIAPDHVPGRNYAAVFLDGWPRPPFALPAPPAGVPAWAFHQVELLGRAQRFAEWYIDHRQVPYGDFGGGISDDTDLLNLWPGIALMGCAPDKLRHSLNALLDAAYANGLFTDGLSTIQTDELHSYEEGINCLGANLILDYASPRQVERAMETTRGLERLTAVNAAGHRHVRSSYFSGTRFATEEPWGCAKAYSHLVFQTPELLADFNGHPRARQLVLEVADGLLAHRHRSADGTFRLPTAIKFATDENADATRGWLPWPLFWTAWQWTGDRKYLAPIFDLGLGGLTALNADALAQLDLRREWGPRILSGERSEATESRRDNTGRKRSRESGYRGAAGTAHLAWQLTGDKKHLEQLYAAQLEDAALLEYINTEGSLWTDRVGVPTAELQRARLGGVALLRNAPFPGHTVSWRFAAPATAQSVAILIPAATPQEFTIVAFNLETTPVHATLTGWNVDPGTWRITQGVDTDDDDHADRDLTTRTAAFERTRDLDITLPPRATSVLTFRLESPGTPYWQRPELGLDPQDVVATEGSLRVTVHSLGSVDAPATTVALLDAAGRTIASMPLPALPAPLDLAPKIATVALPVPAGVDRSSCSVVIDPDVRLEEITRRNNIVRLP